MKFRGFWPINQGSKGKGRYGGRGVKGKFSGKPSSRKTLQQRILESKCRICGRVGDASAGKPSGQQVPTSFVQAQPDDPLPDSLPLEFLQLPMNNLSIDESGNEFVFVSSVLMGTSKDRLRESLGKWTPGV